MPACPPSPPCAQSGLRIQEPKLLRNAGFPYPAWHVAMAEPSSPPFSGFLPCHTRRTVLYVFLLTASSMLTQHTEETSKLRENLSPRPGVCGFHPPWFWGSVTHSPRRRKSKGKLMKFCLVKRKKNSRQRGRSQGSSSPVAQVPPSG